MGSAISKTNNRNKKEEKSTEDDKKDMLTNYHGNTGTSKEKQEGVNGSSQELSNQRTVNSSVLQNMSEDRLRRIQVRVPILLPTLHF